MIRVYIDNPVQENALLNVDKKINHYLSNVMRLKPSDTFLIFNSKDGEWSAKLEGKSVRVLEKIRDDLPKYDDVWLLFAPVKKDNVDYIIQKGTELGVSNFYPVQTDYTNIPRINKDKLLLNAIEATEQCRRIKVPYVHDIRRLNEFLATFPTDRTLFFLDESGEGNTPINIFSKEDNKNIAFLIGPEGGFSEKEKSLIKSYAFAKSISLKGSILRAETAVVAAISAWNALKGEWV